MNNIALLYEVILLPPIIYETSLFLLQSVRVLSNIGKMVTVQIFSILLQTAALILVSKLFLKFSINWSKYIALIAQLNDYPGTLEPFVDLCQKDVSSLNYVALA
jgi:hypothetical protein